jgi:Na+/H+ antiporter NhaD/arsenite permease-like protein|tara:strand:+ start:40 stop:183 length:144 start_codon:yes stop_codon:yes gene_type:complete
MILDNVTTIILIVPVILVITRLLKINPIPLLLSLAILSNISGVATLV